MKKIFKLFIILICILTIVGCEMNFGGGSNSNPLKNCTFSNATFEYDGEVKSIEVGNLPSGATVVYTNNEQTEVGRYDVTAVVSKEGYESVTYNAVLIITAKDYFKGITFPSASFDYDGEKHAIYALNVPDEVEVVYENNEQSNTGEYVAKAILTDKFGNTKVLNAQLTINRSPSTITVEDNQTFVIVDSNGICVNATVDNDEQVVKFEAVDEIKGPGIYKVKVYVNASKNYAASSKIVNVQVKTNVLDVEFEDKTFVYDGTEKTIKLVGESLEGYSVEYHNNVQTEPGRHQVKAIVKNNTTNEVFNVYGYLVIERADSADFDALMDELFIAIFAGDQMSINFFFVNPEDYGLEHYEASLSHANYDDYDLGIEELQTILDELYKFDYNTLSPEQQTSYDIVNNYFSYLTKITLEMQYMTNGYLGSYLGYQANLPLELAEYKFRNETDIQDFIKYLETSEEAFESYYQFSVDQNKYGYGLTNTAIDNVVSQCQKFIEQKENHYLVDIFNDKIDKIDFELSEELVAAYKAQCEKAVKEDLCNAYQYIMENLPKLKDADVVEGGLYHYGEEGLNYYELEFQNIVGYYDVTIEEAIAYVDAKLAVVSKQVNDLVAQFRSMNQMQQAEFLKAVNYGMPYFTDLDPDGIVKLFQDLASDYVPDLGIMPEISIKYVYESLEENFSPAAYFVSPLDETKFESIYLNGKYTDDINYIFTTLAHEGYPGHLYQNVYAKQLDISNVRKVLRCQGYMEGWATYMEFNAYNWVTNYTSKTLKLALEYLKLNDLLNGLATCRVDLGIHGQGWFAQDIADFMSDVFGSEFTAGDMQDIYDQIVEIPTNSSMYFYSYSKLQDMHDNAKEELEMIFDEVEFNKVILDCGAAPLEIVEEAVEQYIEEQKYIHGLK